jgi:hypothetical protein
VKSRASSSDIQEKNRVLNYIILFYFVFLKDYAFFFFFFGFVKVEFDIDSVWCFYLIKNMLFVCTFMFYAFL